MTHANQNILKYCTWKPNSTNLNLFLFSLKNGEDGEQVNLHESEVALVLI